MISDLYGLEPALKEAERRKDIHSIKKIRRMIDIYDQFYFHRESLQDARFNCNIEDMLVFPDDATASTGFDAHYVYHTAWATRVLSQLRPALHIDIGSCLRFVTLASAFVPVHFFDYRPADINLSNLTSAPADITKLPFEDNSISSLSSMHVVEHIGLGRYGDKIDPKGDIKAMKELTRVLAPSGNLLFVVPIGKPRIQFNAHRIYSTDLVLDSFGKLRLKSFALIDDNGNFHEKGDMHMADNLRYGCGCFHFKKD